MGPLALETVKRRKGVEGFARGAPGINWGTVVGYAERHAGINHQKIGKLEKFANRTVERNPGLLRAGVQAVAARQQSDRLEIAADVGPLRGAMDLLTRKEQRDRAPKNS